jgi:hypothetical protein
MAGELYDYLIGLTIMGVIFMSAVLAIPSLSYTNLLYLDQQQFRNIATQTLKTIVLETGYPTNWGSSDPFDQNDVKRFGLAKANSSSFYVLDPDKVQRLVEGNPLGSIEYEKMRELLGLEDYGFSISILPPFNVTVTKEEFEVTSTEITLKLEVKVSHNNGRPISEAFGEALIIYVTKSGNTAKLYVIKERVSTDLMGICVIEKEITAPSGEQILDAIVVLRITVADIATMVVIYQEPPPDDIADINIVGDEIILTHPDGLPPNSTPPASRWIDNIIEFNEESFSFIYNGSRSPEDLLTYGQGFKVWNETFSGLKDSNPTLFLFNFWVLAQDQPATPRSVLIAGPNPNLIGSRVLHFGGTVTSSSSAVKLQRNVVISGMTYIVELSMWKESP